jgi:hypothetical protein
MEERGMLELVFLVVLARLVLNDSVHILKDA